MSVLQTGQRINPSCGYNMDFCFLLTQAAQRPEISGGGCEDGEGFPDASMKCIRV